MAIDPGTERFWADLWRDNRGDVATVAFIVAFFATLVVGWSVTPFHYVDCLELVAVSLGPVLLAAAFLSGLGNRLTTGMAGANPGAALNAVAGLALVAIVCPGNAALWINQRFDASPRGLRNRAGGGGVDAQRQGPHHLARGRDHGRRQPDRRAVLVRHPARGADPSAMGARGAGAHAPRAAEHCGALRFPWFEPEPALAD